MLQNVACCGGASVSPMIRSHWDICATARVAALRVRSLSFWPRVAVMWGHGRRFICQMKELESMVPEFFQTRTDYIILIPEKLCASQLPSTIYRCMDGAHSFDCRSSASNFGAGGSVSMMQEIVLRLCCVTALGGCPSTRKYGNLECGSAGLFSGMPVHWRRSNAFMGWK